MGNQINASVKKITRNRHRRLRRSHRLRRPSDASRNERNKQIMLLQPGLCLGTRTKNIDSLATSARLTLDSVNGAGGPIEVCGKCVEEISARLTTATHRLEIAANVATDYHQSHLLRATRAQRVCGGLRMAAQSSRCRQAGARYRRIGRQSA